MSQEVKDDSSSEDEHFKEALKEAADPDLLTNAYFTEKSNDTQCHVNQNKGGCIKEQSNAKLPQSLRSQQEQDEQFVSFGVTRSFQIFVAKKCCRNVKLKNKSSKEENAVGKTSGSGIKLLSSSTSFLTTPEELDEFPNIHRPPAKRKTHINEKEILSNCREAAVDPEWVLSKKDTEAWVNKRDKPQFRYKRLKSGVLVEET